MRPMGLPGMVAALAGMGLPESPVPEESDDERRRRLEALDESDRERAERIRVAKLERERGRVRPEVPAWESPCPHLERDGRHELYMATDRRMHCRACGAHGPMVEVRETRQMRRARERKGR